MKYVHRDLLSGRRAKVASFKEALDLWMQANGNADRYKENRLIGSWEGLMGKPVARYTRQLFIKNRILYVEITSAPLKNELQMVRSKIKDHLNEFVGNDLVSEVVFL
jgi:predicted nucleic acid-binding Zn ribbon protein